MLNKFIILLLMSLSLLAQTDKPNVILLMTDDQGYGDFGFTGNKVIETPALDKMEATGTHLTDFYVSPVCSPTRASVMTGRYNPRTGVVDTWMGRSVMDPNETTFAELLKSNGYTTSMYGKWHLGDSYPSRSMDQGFDENLVHLAGGIGQPSDKFGYRGKYTDPILYHNGEEVTKKGYCTDIFFDEAIEWMKKQQADKKPFFSFISCNAPHSPYHDVPEGLYQKYLKKKEGLKSLMTYHHKIGDKERELDTLARIAAMITNIDDNVGKLEKFLEESGLAENTIVLFMTDNGPNTYRYSAKYKGKKSYVEKAGIRTPLLIKGPGFKKGKVAGLSAHIDMFPTLAAACGIEVPKELKLDGVNLLPVINEGAEPVDRNIVIQFHRGDKINRGEHFTVINKNWKYNHQTLYQKNGMKEPYTLFKNDTDEYEEKNVIAEYPEVVKKMEKIYNDWFDDMLATQPEKVKTIIGTGHERITMLTRQDFIWVSGNSWYGKASGYWPVVTKKGSYKVTFHTPASDQPIQAVFTYKNVKKEFTIPAGVMSMTFKEIKLPEGTGNMEVKYKYHDHERGGYQILLEKNTPNIMY